MKKIMFVVDTPARDLKTAAHVAYWLDRKHGYRTIVSTPKNELAGLVRFMPDMLILPHVRYTRQREALEFARKCGIQVAILPSEGLPWIDKLVPKSVVGLEELHPYVDLIMSWGPGVAERLRAERSLEKTSIRVVGCPRFDAYRADHAPLRRSRGEFCREIGLESARPLVLWISNTAYANPGVDVAAQVRQAVAPGRSAEIVKDDLPLDVIYRDHQTTFDFMAALFRRHAEENPEISHLVRPHPMEPVAPYHEKLAGLKNVRVLSNETKLEELFAHADVQINWRCTTSLENWLMDLGSPTITVEAPDVRTDLLACLAVGNDIVSGYDGMRERVSFYLGGGEVSSDLLAKRREFITRCVDVAERSASERCADAVEEQLRGRPRPARGLGALATSARQLMRNARRRQWVSIARAPGHPKYFAPSELDGFVRSLDRVHGFALKSGRIEVFA